MDWEQAIIWAESKNLPPFVSEPDPTLFDPMDEPDWTPAMAVAWIIWRTPEAVREYWDEYREKCTIWVPHDQILPGDQGQVEGRREVGWETDKWRPATITSILSRAAIATRDGRNPHPPDPVNELRKKLAGGALEATGIPRFVPGTDGVPRGRRNRILISRREWNDLLRWGVHDSAQNSVATANDREPRYEKVRVPSQKVFELWWPKSRKGKRGRRTAIDWTKADEKIFELMDYHGEFHPSEPEWDCQARLEAEITKYVSDEFGETAVKSETTIREHVRPSLEKWRRAKAGN